VTPTPDALPDDVAGLRAALAAEQLARREAEARASGAEAMVAYLKLLIAKLKHDRFGASSERGRKLLDQLELELDELVTAASEDRARAGSETGKEGSGDRAGLPPRRQPVRAPLPAHLPRERVVIPAPTACPCCGGKLSKLGEDITETLEVVPRSWKVIQTVRERFSCRACETITQPPAPFHPITRGRAGPNLLAMVLEAKFGQHLPLNRQSDTFAREGVELGVSTLADWVGTCTAMLAPLVARIDAHVLAAERLHGDDTTVPLMARGKTVTARLWTYVRDDRPFAGPAPPAAMFRYSQDRTAEHPNRHLAGYTGTFRRTPMPGSTISTSRDASPAPSPRPRAGPMAGANCSSSPRSPVPRSRPRRCGGSTRSLMPSAPSTGCRPNSALPCGTSTSRLSWPTSGSGCVSNAEGCRGMPTWPRPWITCSSAGTRSPGSRPMAGSA
jgi:transposase